MENKIKISYFNKYTTELHLGKLSDDDVAMILLKDHVAATTELEKENERLATNLIETQIEHPCYKLSKELEAENEGLTEKITALTDLLKMADENLSFFTEGTFDYFPATDKARQTRATIAEKLKEMGL